jgi:hypothetical protein
MKKTPIFILKFTRERGIKDAGNGKWIFPKEKTGKRQGEQVLYTIYGSAKHIGVDRKMQMEICLKTGCFE